MDNSQRTSVLAISSKVLYGSVGLSIAVPCLEILGYQVLPIPTVLLANRPGLGTHAALAIRSNVLSDFCEAFRQDGWFERITGILTGYFLHPDQVLKVADVIARIKNDRNDVIYVCDPVLGDFPEGLYVSEETARAVREALLPLADLATPNLFEACWLAGVDLEPGTFSQRLKTLRQKFDIKNLIITSANTGDDTIKSALVTKNSVVIHENKFIADVPKGTGDAFSALMLGNILKSPSMKEAFKISLRQIETLSAAASGAETLAPGLLKCRQGGLLHESD